MTWPLTNEDPAWLTARAGIMRAGVSRAGFAPRDTKDGSLAGTVAGDYASVMEEAPTTTKVVEVAP